MSSSNHRTSGTGMSECSASAATTRYWVSNRSVGNTVWVVGCTRTTNPSACVLAPCAQVASKIRVSFENPVDGGPVISESSRSLTSPSLRCSQAVSARRASWRSRCSGSAIDLL